MLQTVVITQQQANCRQENEMNTCASVLFSLSHRLTWFSEKIYIYIGVSEE